MLKSLIRLVCYIPVLLLLGCASVDQFGSRINDVNANSGDALNDETLLNIIRASNYQGPHFVTISQVTGGQSETLTTGLPNVNFGVLAAADKAYHLTNGVSSGVSSGFTSNPIVTSQFEQGILAPLDGRQIALLMAAYPIEPVLYAVIDSINVRFHNEDFVYLSNPAYNMDSSGRYDPNCREDQSKILDARRISSAGICNYEKFQNTLDLLIKAGLSVELIKSDSNKPSKNTSVPTSVAAASTSNKDKSDTSKAPNNSDSNTATVAASSPKAQFCYLPSQAPTLADAKIFGEFRCGSGKPFPKHMIVDLQGIGNVEIASFGIRSLSGILNYLGKINREGTADKIVYRSTREGLQINSGGPFLDIQRGFGGECIAEASYAQAQFCVRQGSYNTALMINILEQIRNLQISPADLNAPFTVRLTGAT